MGHDEEKEKDPEYWNRIHNILSPLILDTLKSYFDCLLTPLEADNPFTAES